MYNIGILGFGTVGSGVVELILKNNGNIEKKGGLTLNIKKILVKNKVKKRPEYLKELITYEPEDIIYDPEIDLVVEVMGGEEPALTYIQQALKNKKHVVTANKEVISKHGRELLELALQNKVNLLFEASVAGGIPIIIPLKESLIANEFANITAILNGTTNFILTQMEENKVDFSTALEMAKKQGYAESDPSADILGFDAARKIAILASIAFNVRVTPDKVYTEGINGISYTDINYAQELGFTIKLIAEAQRTKDGIFVLVAPVLLRKEHPLSSVKDVYNAVIVEGDAVGRLMFYGKGAGKMPTASAVVSDIIKALKTDEKNRLNCTCFRDERVLPIELFRSAYYFRIKAMDKPGVLSKISGIFGQNNINLYMVIQKNSIKNIAEIVVITYETTFKNIQKAVDEINSLDDIAEVSNVIRVKEEV
ncbi:homoserine dehydrogenase [Thermovenabulum sp.]|uniref:homoserine dehydrogenase n=1 Tax=Thermovenabulum sp. TaxID=3100335 RepID=UPI003C7B7EDD